MLDIVGCCTVETLADRWLGCHIFLGRRGRAKHNAQEKGQWSEHGIQEASTVPVQQRHFYWPDLAGRLNFKARRGQLLHAPPLALHPTRLSSWLLDFKSQHFTVRQVL